MAEKTTPAQPDGTKLEPFERTAIYKVAEDILVKSHTMVSAMPKKFKFITGEAICQASLDLASTIAHAYMELKDLQLKRELTRQVLLKCKDVLILYRMAQRLGIIPHVIYAAQIENCISIMRQANAWLNKQLTNPGQSVAVP